MPEDMTEDVPEATTEGRGRKRTTAQPRLHGEMLATGLLAFLKGCDAYGYQLRQQLSEAGLPRSDSGTVYRALRQMESSGFVSSFWDTSDQGPARRMYSLTAAGEIFLRTWLETLDHYRAVLTGAIDRFEEAAAATEDTSTGEQA